MMKDLMFSRASTAEDFKQISEINAQHLDSQEDSFLVIGLDMVELERLTEDSTFDFYIAKESNGISHGYVEVSTEFDMSLMNEMQSLILIYDMVRKLRHSTSSSGYKLNSYQEGQFMTNIPRMALTKHERRLLDHWVTGEPLVRDPKPKREYRSKPEMKYRL